MATTSGDVPDAFNNAITHTYKVIVGNNHAAVVTRHHRDTTTDPEIVGTFIYVENTMFGVEPADAQAGRRHYACHSSIGGSAQRLMAAIDHRARWCRMADDGAADKDCRREFEIGNRFQQA